MHHHPAQGDEMNETCTCGVDWSEHSDLTVDEAFDQARALVSSP